ncbi:unnamed protein product, partial [Adineta ricciae]
WIFADVYWPAFTIWHLYWIILQYEMKSKTLVNVQNQCKTILQRAKSLDEQKTERIRVYLSWLEERRIERIKL